MATAGMDHPHSFVVERPGTQGLPDAIPALFVGPRRQTVRVSFIVPALNEEKHIGRCLRSIARQQIPTDIEAVEIVVVDNQSVDRTAAVSRELGARVVTVSPGRPSRARNAGAQAAQGDWLAFVDADCELAPDWLATCGSHLASNSHVVAAGGAASPPGKDAPWVQRAWHKLAHSSSGENAKPVRWLPTFNLLACRDAFERAGCFDESLTTCEDCDLGYRLADCGQLMFDPRATAFHLGESQSLGDLFRREAWRTRGNVRLALSRPLDWSNWWSLLVPPCLILGLLASIGGSIAAAALGRPFWPWLGILSAITGVTVLLVWHKTAASNPLSLAQQLIVFATYLAGRTVGLVRPFRRLERSGAPGTVEVPGGAPGTTSRPAAPVAGRRRPMILHARVVTGAGGGPDKTILNSPRFLADLGYECVCAFLRPPADAGFDAIRQRATTWAAPLAEIDDRGPLDWRIVPALVDLCRRHNVDVWHAHDYKTNLLGLLLRRMHPMRLVTTVHGWVEHTPRTRLYHQVDRWSLPRYERVICVSDDIRQQCRDYGVSDAKSVLIENAIDVDQFRRTRSVAAAKELLGWPGTRYLIGAVGRLSPEKAFDVLIRVVHELVRNGVDLGLVIAGDGSERQSLQARVDVLGLSERVRLIGFQSDLPPLYEAMDLFVLSSIREGLPNVLLEAMSLEVPVVATRVAGIPRLVDDGSNGLLVPAGDQAALAQTIRRVLDGAELRSRLAAAGRQRIVERYSFAARMRKVAAVYDELLGKHEGSSPRR